MLAPVVENRVREIWEQRKRVPFSPVSGLTGRTAPAAQWTFAQVTRVLDGARAWVPADELGQELQLSRAEIFDVVAAVGGRLGRARLQSSGSFARLSAQRARVAPGIHQINGKPTVVLPPGWTRSTQESRDISRSFVAVVTLPRDVVMQRAEEWVAEENTDAVLSYFHFAQLRAVARGELPALADLELGGAELAAYSRAFTLIREEISVASAALFKFVTDSSTSLTDLEVFEWLLGSEMRERLRTEGASSRVKMRLAGTILADPASCFPRCLSDLSQQMFWAVTKRLGYCHVEDSAEHAGTIPLAHLEVAWRKALQEHGREAYTAIGLSPSFR